MIYSNKHNTNDIGEIGVFNRKLYDEYGDYDEYNNELSMAFLEVFVVVILYILLLCGVVIIQTCCCVFFKSVCDCFSTRVHPNKFAHHKENVRKRQNKTISRIGKAICSGRKQKTKKNKSNVLKKKKIKMKKIKNIKIVKVRKKNEMYKCKENNKSDDLQKKENQKCVDTPIDSENINIVIQ